MDCLFRKYDQDGNGFLDKKEVVVIINTALSEISGGRKANRSEVNSLIEKSDINKDGKISKD